MMKFIGLTFQNKTYNPRSDISGHQQKNSPSLGVQLKLEGLVCLLIQR